MRMQQEAIRRVREMQRRARSTLENAGVDIGPSAPASAPAGETPSAGAPSAGGQSSAWDGRTSAESGQSSAESGRRERPAGGPPPGAAQAPGPGYGPGRADGPLRFGPGGSLLKSFNLSFDTEQLILLGLLYILYRDRCDPWLMIAVAYILFF